MKRKWIVDAWTILNKIFQKAGVQPTTYIMDNECSGDLKKALEDAELKWQLVPPHQHRANKAERAIQTFKAHFKSILATTDPDFPLQEWDRLLPHAELTLNLLRTSRSNPKLSAYAYLFGIFDYNKSPLVPPGTRVLAHTKPSQQTSWGLKGDQGWTIGPSLDHYRCVKCYFPDTRSERDVDTVTFFPHSIKFPEVNLDDFLRQATYDIITLLTDPPSTTTVSLKAGDSTKNALLEIATLLNRTKLSAIEENNAPEDSTDHTPTIRPPPGFPLILQSTPVTLPRVQQPTKVPQFASVPLLRVQQPD